MAYAICFQIFQNISERSCRTVTDALHTAEEIWVIAGLHPIRYKY